MANLLDLSPDEFMFTLQEFGYSPDRRDELIRQYREHNSVFGALNRAAQERQAEIAGEGRRPVAGGFLSKPEGSLGMDAVRGLRVEPMAGLLGMLTGAGRAVEAPAAAYQGLIPMADVPLEALGTAGMASLGGAAMTRPAGSVGMGGRVAGRINQVKIGDTDVVYSLGEDGVAEISSVRTPPARRGQGSARAAVQSVISDLQDAGASSVRLIPSPLDGKTSPARLVQFYEGLGFNRTGQSANMAGDEWMAKDLNANRDQTVGLLSTAAAAEPRNAAERMARDILDMRAAGRAGEVTDEMMAQADPQYMYNNTPLPMDEASRMARAEAAGYDFAFHGTGADIQAVDPSFFGNGKDLLGSGFYTTTNPQRADGYVPRRQSPSIEVSKEYAEGGNILPLAVREPRPFMLDEPLGSAAQEISDSYSQDPFFNINEMSSGVRIVRDADGNSVMLDPYQQRHWVLQGMRKQYGPTDTSMVLADAGYSGVSGPEGLGGRVRVSYDPTDVRSRFARFDPKFSHLADLNAANVDPLAGLLGTSASQQGPQDNTLLDIFLRSLTQRRRQEN
jgi:ribosomal protein S18 acetylase RimI-like enzyme